MAQLVKCQTLAQGMIILDEVVLMTGSFRGILLLALILSDIVSAFPLKVLKNKFKFIYVVMFNASLSKS